MFHSTFSCLHRVSARARATAYTPDTSVPAYFLEIARNIWSPRIIAKSKVRLLRQVESWLAIVVTTKSWLKAGFRAYTRTPNVFIVVIGNYYLVIPRATP